jgi:hypothetical protein
MQPMHETILAKDTSTPPLQVVPPTVQSVPLRDRSLRMLLKAAWVSLPT